MSNQSIEGAFQTVINYIVSDNEGGMGEEVIDLLGVLKDLQEKARDEELDRKGVIE